MNSTPTAYTPFQKFFQIAYVSNDFDRALGVFRERYGITRFFEMRDVPMQVGPDDCCRVSVGLVWVGSIQLELITPMGGSDAVYRDLLPADGSRFALRMHHVCQRIDSNAEFDATLAAIEQSGARIAAIGEAPGLVRYVYVDQREVLGHYLEHTFYTKEGLEMHAAVPRI